MCFLPAVRIDKQLIFGYALHLLNGVITTAVGTHAVSTRRRAVGTAVAVMVPQS